MNPTIPFPRPDREPSGTIACKWPLLARLPDVSSLPSRAQSPRTFARTAANDYRFDPPQTRSFHHTHDGDHAPHTFRRESPILPRTDPFAIGSARMMETWGPIVRFVLLVALFTAAGVILLAGGNKVQPSAREKLSAESTVMRQTLEPAAMIVDASAPTPSAAGPTSVPDSVGDGESGNSPDATDLTAPTNKRTPDDIHVSRDADNDVSSPYPDTGWAPATLPEAGQGSMPRVQTTNSPQAVAHLPGFITEIPQRHASHDDDQPGLH